LEREVKAEVTGRRSLRRERPHWTVVPFRKRKKKKKKKRGYQIFTKIFSKM
jgi:hypothetical protein